MPSLEVALTYARTGRYIEAVREYQNIADLFLTSSVQSFDSMTAICALNGLLTQIDISADTSNSIGIMYHTVGNVRAEYYVQALKWYEKAKAKAKEFAFAYRNIGLLYEDGLGVPKNYLEAAKHYQQAIDRGCAFAQQDLDRLFNKQDISSEGLNLIGLMYGNALEISKNYTQALKWYEKSKAQGFAPAYRNVGCLYEHDAGISKSYPEAARHYQQAIDRGYAFAQQDLDRLFNKQDISAEDLNSIGLMYGMAMGVKGNYIEALKWYEKAKAKGSGAACRNVGCLLYECGLGIPKNYPEAARHYQQAIEKGFAEAQADLDRVFGKADIASEDLNFIGAMYHRGVDVQANYVQAARWYEKAKTRNFSLAYRNMGLLHEEALGIPKNYSEAVKHYQQAIEKGNIVAQADIDRVFNKVDIPPEDLAKIGKMYHYGEGVAQNFEKARMWYEKISGVNSVQARKLLKMLERDWAIKRASEVDDYVNEVDGGNRTRLHRAAADTPPRLKDCMRFILLGADKTKKDGDTRVPLRYLAADKQRKLTALQNHYSHFINQLEKKAPDIIVDRIISDGKRVNRELSVEVLRRFHEIAELKPLMDLAKLAVLGHHDLSGRPKFSNENYDSDEDDREPMTDDQKFMIRIDASRKTSEGIYHFGGDGLGAETANGLYLQNKNAIYLGAKDRTQEEVRGTLFHELTHFVAYEVFKNDCKPYGAEENTLGNPFDDIFRGLETRRLMLDPVLSHVFDYQPQNHHAEMIVRVPQMLAQYPDGLDRLRQQAPDLLYYYNSTFLPAVRNHIDKLEKRALSGWPMELFAEKREGEVMLDVARSEGSDSGSSMGARC